MDTKSTKAPTAIIYVTGAPGTGKSTLIKALQTRFSNAEVFSYGAHMARHLQARYGSSAPDALSLRGGTDQHVTIEDIRSVDQTMVSWTVERQAGRLLLIDTHQVTLETTGLRFIPFQVSDLDSLPLTMIWLLSAAAESVVNRIASSPKGRIVPSVHEAETHAAIQYSVAVMYAIRKNIELRVFNGDNPPSTVLEHATSCLLGANK